MYEVKVLRESVKKEIETAKSLVKMFRYHLMHNPFLKLD